MIRRAAAVTWIVVVWLIATGSVTPGAIIGGTITGLLLTRLFHLEAHDSGRFTIRPIGMVRFAGYFLSNLARANAQVALAVVQPARVRHRRAIVAVPITECSETLTWFLANAVSLTPGTTIVDLRPDPTVLYLHVLLLTSVDDVRREVLEMQRRLLLAFGPTEAVRDVERRIANLSPRSTDAKERP